MARMSRRISRRRFVDGTVRLALLTPVIHLELTAAGQTRTPFRAVDRRTLRAAADVIIPAQRQMPAASAVGAVRYIERIAAADRAVEGLLRDGLRAIAAHAEATQNIRFDQLTIERQTEVLAHVETTNTPASFFGTLRDLVYEAYYTQPGVQKLVGYNFRSGRRRTAPVAPFDEQLVARVRQQKPIYRQVILMAADRVDVVVIGSGAAGAAVTWRLATYGASVLCLEQGDWLRPDDFRVGAARIRSVAAPRPIRVLAERPQAARGLSGDHRRRWPDEHRDVERRRRQHGPLGRAFPAVSSLGLRRAATRRCR